MNIDNHCEMQWEALLKTAIQLKTNWQLLKSEIQKTK